MTERVKVIDRIANREYNFTLMRRNKSDKNKSRLLYLLKKNAFFKKKIILSSGKESSYYIDGRLITLSGEGAYLSAKLILDNIKKDKIQAIGGPTIGADPIIGAIAALSFLEKKPMNTFLIRKASKKHGRKKQIEGPILKKGSKVIVVDDVATSGGSIVDALKVLRRKGIKVKKAIALVDRQEGAEERLTKLRCPLVSIFKASDFLI